MYKLYRLLSYCSDLALSVLLKRRLKNGKELTHRVDEKKGIPTLLSTDKPVIWLHAASIGESQSALILIKRILEYAPRFNILVTTGTITSAALMGKHLPHGAFHQFCPLDNPHWIKRFIHHWNPPLVFWMESELWPNILMTLKKHNIPTILVNAHMSPRSFARWKKYMPALARQLTSSFDKILCQTHTDNDIYTRLGSENTVTTGNLKYSAAPLPYDNDALTALQKETSHRPMWLYASTHKDEETIAANIHIRLKESIPNLLTIIVPRHPERRTDIKETLSQTPLCIDFRGDSKNLPTPETDIYIADTLGELGLFYRLSPIACIGRSFSDDGGGGHNPLEAAQLSCAITHGPLVQNLQDIFDDMNKHGAAQCAKTVDDLYNFLHTHLTNQEKTQELQTIAYDYAQTQTDIIETVMHEITPFLDRIEIKEAQ